MSIRTDNKQRRRERILKAAGQILLDEGYDGLTTRGLAAAAGVTVPTLYNLIGGKDDILHALIAEGTERIWQRWDIPEGSASLNIVDDWIGLCITVVREDEETLRAAAIAADRIVGLYAASGDYASQPTSAASRAMQMARVICLALRKSGALRGALDIDEMAEQMFISFKDPFRDWTHGLIPLEEVGRRFTRGVYMVLCADATDTTRRQLIVKLRQLQKTETASKKRSVSGEQ